MRHEPGGCARRPRSEAEEVLAVEGKVDFSFLLVEMVVLAVMVLAIIKVRLMVLVVLLEVIIKLVLVVVVEMVAFPVEEEVFLSLLVFQQL